MTAALQKAASALEKAEKLVQRLSNQQSSEPGPTDNSATDKRAPEVHSSISTATAAPEGVETTPVAAVSIAAINSGTEVLTTATMVAPIRVNVDSGTQPTTTVEDVPIAVNKAVDVAQTSGTAGDGQQIGTLNEDDGGTGKRKRRRTENAEDDEPVVATTDLGELESKFLGIFWQ
jgi:Tfp pilus assembly protein PilX